MVLSTKEKVVGLILGTVRELNMINIKINCMKASGKMAKRMGRVINLMLITI